MHNGSLLYSASDLNHFVECEHRAWLERQRTLGRIPPPEEVDPGAALAARKGQEHEAATLEGLRREGRDVVEIVARRDDLEAAAERTLAALRGGASIVYQGVLLSDGWLGFTDFLYRVERPSAFGAWGYEVVDAKLARRTRPYFLLQLCSYSDHLAKLQGAAPEKMHVILGTHARESFLCREYDAYFRHVRGRFLDTLGAGADGCYPVPVEHCGICPWASRCEKQWEDDDHLCLVANLRRDQVPRLGDAGIRSLADLGRTPAGTQVGHLAPATFEALRDQARLQLAQRETGEHLYELLPPAFGRGFALLPPPSPADVFFDMEGDPFFEGGLEYLFGALYRDGTQPTYRAWWGHDAAGEKRAFEEFVDFVTERRARAPGLHVYHYAHYEPTALKRLAGRYGTREEALDALLRAETFVDLYRVVRQSLRVSQPSYSIKKLEVFYMGARRAEVKDAADSIVAYEHWLDEQDPAILDGIARYNEEDCRSTLGLRDWLLERRTEAERRFGPPPPPPPPEERPPSPEQEQIRAETAALVTALTAGLPESIADLSGEQRAGWLLAQLLDYHRREERPAWWLYFDRLKMTPEELIRDPESLGALEPDGEHPPVPDKRSTIHSFKFPPQEFKIGPGAEVSDPETGKLAGTVLEVDARAWRLSLRRGPSLDGAPLPRALIPGGPYNTREQRAALRRLASSVAESGLEGAGPYRALRDVLRRDRPRLRGLPAGAALQGETVDEDSAWRVVSALDDSYLFVQGPPGSGKTYLGARLIVRLLEQGERVGVTALSHRAIHNLLHEVEKVAGERGVSFSGLKKASGGNSESFFASENRPGFIANVEKNPSGWPAGCELLAGTAWLFSPAGIEQEADYLFVDEAGQISLADALAVGTSARNLVFLGDPQQLPQVSQGTHPEGAGASVLEHLLGGERTVPADRGLFLEQTWRMHPDVCRFISELIYEGRLHSAPGRERQRVASPGLGGTGLRYLGVAHLGNSQRSREEADAIRSEYDKLLAGSFTGHDGATRRLAAQDILVVAPYNAHVHCLGAALPAGARVGTVDKFQGQEAAVVFFSMATSSGEELPHTLEFLFSRNRLNVAISRARALAVLVASPRLLDVRCHDADQMRMVNALCRFVEMAGGCG